MARVLVVDDEASLREFLEVLLSRHGHQVLTARSVEEATNLLNTSSFDVVVSDFRIGSGSGIDVIRVAKVAEAKPEVIVITAYATPATAVEAMRQGAYDYIGKPFDNAELLLLVDRAFEKRSLTQENQQLKQRPVVPGAKQVFLGDSLSMKALWALVAKVAPTRSNVLITGESGSGKEVVARVLHAKSPRAAAPFVAINCAAIPEGVLESELFGHMKGAFTGATQDRSGILVSAGDGTVLLDEIGEVPMTMQAKLLRVLQERMVKPVGGNREVAFSARVLAATNRNLETEVKAGRFREDLLFRLNVITVDVPPLRERREDMVPLAHFFLARSAEELGRPGLRFSQEAQSQLASYRFPGNLRQLENVVARAALLSDEDEIRSLSLPADKGGFEGRAAATGHTPPPQLGDGFSLETMLEGIERRYLETALAQAGGIKMKAAELLGLSFRSFRYRLAKLGLGPDEPT
jgi:two-component system, NtrC family, response regulator PilR